MIIVYTGKARQDLRAVYDYICFHLLSPDTAKETTNRIMKAVRALDTMPERNPPQTCAKSVNALGKRPGSILCTNSELLRT